MFRKDQLCLVFNTFFSLMFAIVLPIFMELRKGGFGLEQFLMDFIPGFTVPFAIGTFIDLKAMGDRFARFCKVKNENGLLFHILRVASITFVLTFIMSLLMMFLSVGFSLGGVFFLAFAASFPLTYLVALITAFITFAIGLPICGALCTKEPLGSSAARA